LLRELIFFLGVMRTSLSLLVSSPSAIGLTAAIATTASEQQGEVQVESRGDLEATLNGEVFRTGDTTTVSGTIDNPAIGSFLDIEVIDPDSKTVELADPGITADDTFTYSFVAGEEKEFDVDEPMVRSGNYRMVVTYYENARDYDINEVQFVFRYIATSAAPALSQSEDQSTTAEAVFATPSPNGPGQPQVECGEDGLGNGPHGFSTSGFENAETHYAGSDGTPSLQHANSDKAVSQYDVACLQTTGK
jgi:hypothetical protein